MNSTKRPLKAVHVLLPIWGRRFVVQFLEFCLPTLLAPGNIPALAEELPCKFIFLTRDHDMGAIKVHPAFQSLTKICEVEFQSIDDLVTDGNHSATITLAFAQAVRECGASSTNTCFFFLMSDYIITDGSLKNVLDRVQSGANGVLAGNFQVVAEDAIPALREWLPADSAVISLKARELIAWSFNHLHPATVSNLVDYPFTHNFHTNRLFWRVDENTLLGRFYLMHPIAIQPEVSDFTVGSSFDYSFIPELCPSNNVVLMTDSDDYLVVEMQPRYHEARNLQAGPLSPKELASQLSEWATARHRENSRQTIVYHTSEIDAGVAEVRASADAFIELVDQNLRTKPQPFRHHPYWIGSMAAHLESRGRNLISPVTLAGVDVPEIASGFSRFLWWARFKFFGRIPSVGILHPLWPDFRILKKLLTNLELGNAHVLIVADNPIAYSRWLAEQNWEISIFKSEYLFDMTPGDYAEHLDTYDCCILFLPDQDAKVAALVEAVRPLLGPGATMVTHMLFQPPQNTAKYLSGFFNYHFQNTQFCFVPIGLARRFVQSALHRLLVRFRGDPLKYTFWFALGVLPITLANLVLSFFARSVLKVSSAHRCSSLTMIVTNSSSMENPRRLVQPAELPQVAAAFIRKTVTEPGGVSSRSNETTAPASARMTRGKFRAKTFFKRDFFLAARFSIFDRLGILGAVSALVASCRTRAK